MKPQVYFFLLLTITLFLSLVIWLGHYYVQRKHQTLAGERYLLKAAKSAPNYITSRSYDRTNPSAETAFSTDWSNRNKAWKYMFVSGATYCPLSLLKDWSCPSCQIPRDAGFVFAGSVENLTAGTFAFFALDHKAKEIFLSFRGSINLTNFDMVPHYFDNSIWINGGFMHNTRSLYSKALNKLTVLLKNNPGYRLILSGHSLGGAIATVTLFMLIRQISLPTYWIHPDYELITYGSPRVGGKAFAELMNGLGSINMTRVVYNGDIIPHLPKQDLSYVHIGNELWIRSSGEEIECSKYQYEDPACNKSLSSISYSLLDHLRYPGAPTLECFREGTMLVKQFAVRLGAPSKWLRDLKKLSTSGRNIRATKPDKSKSTKCKIYKGFGCNPKKG